MIVILKIYYNLIGIFKTVLYNYVSKGTVYV